MEMARSEGGTAVAPTRTMRAEAKNEITTRVAREIIDGEAATRLAKTERLRAARMAQETVAPGKPEKAAKPARRKR